MIANVIQEPSFFQFLAAIDTDLASRTRNGAVASVVVTEFSAVPVCNSLKRKSGQTDLVNASEKLIIVYVLRKR
ncbi:hypothetical protein GALL_496770 [mine drainage metagenome]|uniref:Uncharacterized protein n=1 Tax=mine drainage metagenome TaxID=410659 RepID=A0A1J5PYL6_9ZZZZ